MLKGVVVTVIQSETVAAVAYGPIALERVAVAAVGEDEAVAAYRKVASHGDKIDAYSELCGYDLPFEVDGVFDLEDQVLAREHGDDSIPT